MDRHGDRLSNSFGWRSPIGAVYHCARLFGARLHDQDRRPGGTDGISAKERLHGALEQVIGYAISTIEDFDPSDRSRVQQRNRDALTMGDRLDKEVRSARLSDNDRITTSAATTQGRQHCVASGAACRQLDEAAALGQSRRPLIMAPDHLGKRAAGLRHSREQVSRINGPGRSCEHREMNDVSTVVIICYAAWLLRQ
jgi:hypothetical protein